MSGVTSTGAVSLVEVFHLLVRWEGLDLGLRVRPPSPSPQPASGNLGCSPFWIRLEKQSFRTAWDIWGQKFRGVGLKLKAFILTFWDLLIAYHVCHKKTWEWLVRAIWSGGVFPGSRIFSKHIILLDFQRRGGRLFSKASIFQHKLFRPFNMSSY